MFKEMGYILLSFFITYLAFEGILFLMEKDYGIKLPIDEKLYLSYNGGQDWLAIKVPDKRIMTSSTLSFDPEDPQRLYLASPRGIFYSTNQKGRLQAKETKFETETEPILISKIITSLHNPEIVYLISEEIGRNKVLVSYNKGETFRPIFISQEDNKVSAFSVDPFYPHILYLGTEQGTLLKSEDFGNSWEQKNNFPQEIGQIAPNPHKKEEIYILLSVKERDPFDYWSQRIPAKIMISQDGGNKFKEVATKVSIPEARQIAFDPIINRVYFVSDFSLLRKGGAKIEKVKVIFPSYEGKINSFTINPKNSNILYLGVGELIYKSEDDGNNWQIIESPIRGDIKEIKINPEDPQILIISIEKTL